MTRFWITLDQGVRFVVRCVEAMKGGEVFVPKIPSMCLGDLADAIGTAAAESDRREAWREDHEILVSPDEARHGVEYDDMYVIYSANPCSRRRRRTVAFPGQRLLVRQRHQHQWLDLDQFKALLQ